MEEYYDIFAELLEEERVYMDPGLTFDSICRWIGVSRADFDMYLMSETGCSGSDILKAYRGAASLRFLKKYGILL